jgi:DNA-directed RNA polymerase omega subunit
MKARVLSRGPQIDTEQCVRNVGMGRFDLVLIAAARAREIKRQNKESEKYEHTHSIVTALLEIQEGNVDPIEYLRKVK